VAEQQTATTEVAAQHGSRSSFTPFLSETSRLQENKNIYLDLLLEMDLTKQGDRDSVIRVARNMYDDILNRIGSKEDWDRLANILGNMQSVNKNLQVNRDVMSMANFEDEAHFFINKVTNVLQTAGLGLKLTEDATQLDSLAKDLGADTFYKNKYGMYINYNLDVMAGFFASRVHKELDNFWAVEGKEGYGKSTLAMQLGTTISEKLGVPFDITRNVFFNEKKDYVYNTLRAVDKPEVFIFDEAANQANKKQWWKTQQVELMTLFTLMRYKGTTVLFCIPSLTELDVVLREHRLHGVLSIPDRGQVVVKVPNLNPQGAAYQMEGYSKTQVVTAPSDMADFINTFDRNRKLDFPFWEMPKGLPIWKQYQDLKDTSVTGRKMARDWQGRLKTRQLPKSEQMILLLLTTLPVEQATLNEKQCDAFGVKVGYNVTFDGVVRYICRRTGLSQTDLIKIPNATESADINSDAYIELTEPHVATFLEHIRSQNKGVGVNA